MAGFGIHVDQYPSGRWGFVGSVPGRLLYAKADGSDMTQEDWDAMHYSNIPAMTAKARGIVSRVFDTRADALEAADAAGVTVANR